VEGDLHEHLAALIEGGSPALLTYGITDEMAADVGLSCGGEIDVLVESHRAGDPVWEGLAEALDACTPVVLITGVAPSIRSRRLLVTTTGGGHGSGFTETVGGLGTEDLDQRARIAAV
jgi:xanthine dehydrogenase accessory factor